MRGCLTLMVLIVMAGSAIAMVGASFLYCLALVVVWLVLIIVGKVFGPKTKDEDDTEDDTIPE